MSEQKGRLTSAMIERPATLSDTAIRQALARHHGLDPVDICFLPLGLDPGAAIFRVQCRTGETFLLKTRPAHRPVAGLLVPLRLRSMGQLNVCAPIPGSGVAGRRGSISTPESEEMNQQNRVVIEIEQHHTAALYPFIEGRQADQSQLDTADWHTLGELLRIVHATDLAQLGDVGVAVETFVPPKLALLDQVEALLTGTGPADALTRETRHLWGTHRVDIAQLRQHAGVIGDAARARTAIGVSSPFVLCHGDIHLANVLVDTAGALHLIDWDETCIAPRERDLMFLLPRPGDSNGYSADPLATAFKDGYGVMEPDPVMLAWYLIDWALQEIAEFGWQALDPVLKMETRQHGLEAFRRLFAPHNVIEQAVSSLQYVSMR